MPDRSRGSASPESTRDRSVLVGKLAEILGDKRPGRVVAAMFIDMAFRVADLRTPACPRLPILWAVGTGSDVMKRIGAPLIGGVFTSFLLELLVYPARSTSCGSGTSS